MKDTICNECKHCFEENIINDIWLPYCEEDSRNFQTADGCYRYEKREEDLD